MLLVEKGTEVPYAASISSDLRNIEAPHAVCVAKCRFIFCVETQQWVWSDAAPDFQEIDCWKTIPSRQVTDLVPEKKQAELLLWGQVKPQSQVLVQDAADMRTLIKTGNLAPEPVLYWQGEWRDRPKGKSAMQDFMVAPAYARFSQPWEKREALRFQGIFSTPSIAADTLFRTNTFDMLGTLVSGSDQSIVPFSCDTICVNTDKGHIDMLWRARFPWDLMGEQVGVLYLRFSMKV